MRNRLWLVAPMVLLAGIAALWAGLSHYGINPLLRAGIASSSQAQVASRMNGQPVFIRIFKQESELELWTRMPASDTYELQKTYDICSWSGELGPKLKEGDGQSPEGFYEVSIGQLNPNSSYHLSFNLGFPNAYDKQNGRTGSFLMVHGACVSIGCYAMTDDGIDEIYGAVKASLEAANGETIVPVHIFPFRMSEENMDAHKDNEWHSFWQNLQEGYTAFEKTNVPPTAFACGGRYGFEEDDACDPINAWEQ